MNTISCPTCGAPVTFRSAASVMAVCDYCKSTLVKDADSVRNIGRMSDVLEDYSPIQMNTSGSVDGVSFTVVGRIQLRYDAGFWNEWYVLDDRGEGGWLSDASGQYVFTRAVDPATLPMQAMPRFEQIHPGGPLDLGQAPDGSRLVFIAGDVRSAQCTGGQGELPFTVGSGYTARVADFHRGVEFLTLDYSDDTGADASTPAPTPSFTAPNRSAGFGGSAPAGTPRGAGPIVYRGRAVTLESIKAQLLRDPETIKDEAGRFKGKVSNLECPSCGASIPFSPGATSHLVCPTCHATIDATSSTAEVIAAAQRMDAVHTTIALGAKATIAAVQFTVIGLMRRAEISDDGGEWTEYLLYAPSKGFVWLVETDEGWERADVLDAWPFWFAANQANYDGTTYGRLYDYQAVVKYAAGAFNWKVSVGDVTRITEFGTGGAKLAAESNAAELTWSRSVPVSPKDLAMWFGKEIDAAALAAAPAAGLPSNFVSGPGGFRRVAKWLTIMLLIINVVPILFSPGRALITTALAVACLYIPAWFMDMAAEKRSG
jgi:ribosomal protein L37AE/L43A